MIISSNRIVSMTEANQNFSKVVKNASKYGDTVIFKNNKPSYVVFDINIMGQEFIKEYEKLKIKYLSEKLLEEYDEAYKELAKWNSSTSWWINKMGLCSSFFLMNKMKSIFIHFISGLH